MAFFFPWYDKCDKQKCFASYQEWWARCGELQFLNASDVHVQYLRETERNILLCDEWDGQQELINSLLTHVSLFVSGSTNMMCVAVM